MGLLVGDQIDNKTEKSIAESIRLIAIGWAFAGVMAGLWFVSMAIHWLR